ncbi:alpha/beta hydrolase [Hydrogenophaga laconesensis]|uniref:Dienelactone hydrolase n=1 Tax=Hydrogenophaga laconesensis TaxID=1805971 RepID=A0ABU1V6Z7_9BURK|nr:CocE/NonD family hydrolase [Hydrogenophaga laconesensis]MDR7093172.1 dienelactone hydrolase [Hydrogenophaga laconesensis]
MRWLKTGAPDAPPGVRVDAFEVLREGRRIPGLLWRPMQAHGPVALVLVQHGGSGHKGDASVLELVDALCARGLSVVAIDGLIHGDRRTLPPAGREALLQQFLAFWQTVGGERETLVADWLHVIDALGAVDGLANAVLGWCGLSMGTAYGMTVVARCPSMRAAVLGKWSATHANSRHLLSDAAQVKAATLFVQHWDDELFDRQGTLDVFSALATPDKRLVVYPGAHFGRSPEELALTVDFLVQRLRGAAQADPMAQPCLRV